VTASSPTTERRVLTASEDGRDTRCTVKIVLGWQVLAVLAKHLYSGEVSELLQSDATLVDLF